ncbi:MAG: cadherin-like beta sandwich domain-containing protein [Clostridia bacterium]|nr:cadherin-like beta sandwich domain-containing protein [Clostridia bacterium]
MKKNIRIILLTILSFIIMTLFISVDAATASISANKTSATVGDTVTISVSMNAAAWNTKLTGAVTKNFAGNSDDGENMKKVETVTFTPSAAGSYTINLGGDVSDGTTNATTNVSGSVTITVSEKKTEQPAQQPAQQQTQQPTQPTQPVVKDPTFTNVNKTMYTTGGCNLRSSWSTSSAATSVAEGTELTVTGTSTEKVNGYVWYRVNYNGTKYIANFLLTDTKPAEKTKDEEKKEEEKKEEENKQKSTNKALKDLVIENYKLTPSFDPDTTKYTLEVGADVEKLDVSPITQDEKAEAEVSGNTNLKVGTNTITVKVTAEDQTTRFYTISVTKTNKEKEEKTDKLLLKKLEIKNATLTPSFSADETNYTIAVSDPASIKAEDITALAEDEDVDVKIALSEDSENNERLITIMLEKKDGENTQSGSYQIVVKKSVLSPISNLVNKKDNKIYYILGAIIGVLLLFIVIIIVLLKKTSAKEYDDYDVQDEDELDDNYDYSLKNAIDEANSETSNEIGLEYDEMVENSNVKSQILNTQNYNVFEDKGDGVGVDDETKRYDFYGDDDFDSKPKKRGKHF